VASDKTPPTAGRCRQERGALFDTCDEGWQHGRDQTVTPVFLNRLPAEHGTQAVGPGDRHGKVAGAALHGLGAVERRVLQQPPGPVPGARTLRTPGRVGDVRMKPGGSPMRAVGVAVPLVGGQGSSGVGLVREEDVVECLAPDAADHTLAVDVHPQSPRSALDHFSLVGLEDGVEGASAPTVAVAQKKA
jgi:hypothetical protein